MTTGKQETTSKQASPRRREDVQDDPAAIGDAAILLKLPNLCGVTDPSEMAMPAPDMSCELGDLPEPAPDFDSLDKDRDEAGAPAATSDDAGDDWSSRRDEDADSAPAAADNWESSPPTDEPAEQPAKSRIHRNVVIGTAVFVVTAVIYLVANHDSSGPETATPAVDVDMGWETAEDVFSDDLVSPEVAGPAYGSEFNAPMLPEVPAMPQLDSYGEQETKPLPALNEAASDGFESQRLGVRADYPTTATPDAAYTAERPGSEARTSP